MKLSFLSLCSALLLAGAHAQSLPRPRITGVSHLAVYTSDPAKAEHFYVHDLGAMKGTDPQNSAGVRYYFSPVQFIEVLPIPDGNPAKNRFDHVAYNVSDAEAMRRYLGANGVSVPAAVTRGSDDSTWFLVKDPEQNSIEFVQTPHISP